jgi:hypothetical protein
MSPREQVTLDTEAAADLDPLAGDDEAWAAEDLLAWNEYVERSDAEHGAFFRAVVLALAASVLLWGAFAAIAFVLYRVVAA